MEGSKLNQLSLFPEFATALAVGRPGTKLGYAIPVFVGKNNVDEPHCIEYIPLHCVYMYQWHYTLTMYAALLLTNHYPLASDAKENILSTQSHHKPRNSTLYLVEKLKCRLEILLSNLQLLQGPLQPVHQL